ncbi:hypothetical protein BpHYR1_017549 [Brachionus plicatilis]|uniref:Uncharacterized protein n=1 Tax=Brachionus plicatilis TaxID=10195 RepID=A0A3M7R3P5_BRAPC|nr:hypothetical protein BpHYR1_017549 [Brachionus plicatilis]
MPAVNPSSVLLNLQGIWLILLQTPADFVVIPNRIYGENRSYKYKLASKNNLQKKKNIEEIEKNRSIFLKRYEKFDQQNQLKLKINVLYEKLFIQIYNPNIIHKVCILGYKKTLYFFDSQNTYFMYPRIRTKNEGMENSSL